VNTRCALLCLVASIGAVAAQTPKVELRTLVKRGVDAKVTVVRLAPRFTTAIRMSEPVSSVVVGDPASFQAEHSEQEPQLVFVKPITSEPAQTNLLVSTTRGRQASLLLISPGESENEQAPSVDFLLDYRPAGRFLIEPSDYPSTLTPRTVDVRPHLPVGTSGSAKAAAAIEESQLVSEAKDLTSAGTGGMLAELLERQRRAELPRLYGRKPGLTSTGKERVRAGISEVIDQGRQVVVLFSVVNLQRRPIELMPPQIQLGGKTKSGKIFRRSRWSTAEQLPVTAFRMSRRRLGPGERADGVVVFDRPGFKQSNETLFLQMAESGAVDRPALAPIGFGISTFREEQSRHGR